MKTFKIPLAAAAAAKSLQSCPTLCDPIDSSPPGSPVPGILQARTLEWVAISFSNAWKWKVKVKSLSPVRLLATQWTAVYQAPLSMGFSQARVLEWGAITFSTSSPLATIKYSLANYSHHAVNHTYRTYLFDHWKFVSFEHIHPFHTFPASGNHQSVLCKFHFFFSFYLFFKIPHVRPCLSLTYFT